MNISTKFYLATNVRKLRYAPSSLRVVKYVLQVKKSPKHNNIDNLCFCNLNCNIATHLKPEIYNP